MILKITLISKIGRVLIILFFTRMLKSNDTISRNDQTKTKFFLSALNMIGFSASLLLRKLMQLFINFTISFK